MFSKRRVATALIIGGMGMIILIQGMMIGLPVLAERLIKSRVPELPAGFEPGFTIESVGLRKARVGGIHLGEDIRADSLEIYYAWGPGSPFEIKKVTLSGLSLNADVDAAYKVHLNGLILNEKTENTPSLTPAKIRDQIRDQVRYRLPGLAPFIPKQIALEYARLNINHKGRSLVFPFYCRTRLDPGTGRGESHAMAWALGQPLEMTAEADLEKGLTKFTLDSRAVSPAGLSGRVLPDNLLLTLTGPADIHAALNEAGTWQFRLSNLGLQGPAMPTALVKTATGGFDMATRALTLSADLLVSDIFNTPLPLALKLNGSMTSSNPFRLTVTSPPLENLSLPQDAFIPVPKGFETLAVSKPEVAVEVEGHLNEQEVKIRFSGDRVAVEKEDGSDLSISGLTVTAQSRGNFLSGGRIPEITWSMKAGKTNVSTPAVTAGSLSASGHLVLNSKTFVSLEQAKLEGQITHIFGRDGIHGLSIGTLRFSGDTDGGPDSQTLSLTGALGPVSANSGNRRLAAARCGWSGRVILYPDRPPAFDLTPWVEGGSLILPGEAVSADALSFKSRITRPFVPGAAGKLSIGRLSFENRLHASFDSRLDQVDGQTFRLTGTLTSPDLINKNLGIEVKAGIDPGLWAECHAASSHFLISDRSVTSLFPKIRLPGEFNLDTSADLWAAYRYGIFSSRAALEIHGGSVNFPESNLAAEGITGRLGIRDLAKMESYPGQLLTIDTISMGQFRFDNATLRFRIEDRNSLGIENLKFNWCNGLVSSEATQLSFGDGPVRLILFCDRLEMATLLNQMGAFDAEGGGTLTGRIPVTYSTGDISFEQGFLFSMPGQGGRVAVRDLDRLMAGFPKGTPEASYLEMAGEALKDFQYNWATLKMNSQGDTLTVNMELDGKPARILPFEFNKETNAFIRVKASSPGANFQGIKLDLNLKLPFNQVAKFGNKLKGLMD